MLDPESVRTDPFNLRLKDLGRFLMYRSILSPTNEMIAERLLDTQDVFYVHEVHHLKVPHGQYTVQIQDVSNKIKLFVKDIRLNGVMIPDLSFNV